jgi:hypothetical protein
MAFFSFTNTVLDDGTTFIFGSWIYVTNGSSGFKSHLADYRKLEAFAATRHSDLDEFIDNLNEFPLPDLAGEIERMSIFDTTSTRTAPRLLRSNSNHLRMLHSPSPSLTWRRTWIIFSSSEMREPLPFGGPPFSTTTQTQTQSTR